MNSDATNPATITISQPVKVWRLMKPRIPCLKYLVKSIIAAPKGTEESAHGRMMLNSLNNEPARRSNRPALNTNRLGVILHTSKDRKNTGTNHRALPPQPSRNTSDAYSEKDMPWESGRRMRLMAEYIMKGIRRILDFLRMNCRGVSLSQLVNKAEMKKKKGIWKENIHLPATGGREEWPTTIRHIAIPFDTSTQLCFVVFSL